MGRRYNILNAPDGWVDDYSIYLDGVDEYVNIDSVLADLQTSNVGTIHGWIKPVNPLGGGNERFVTFGDTNANEFFIFSYVLTTGKIQAGISISGSIQWLLRTDAPVTSSLTWHHVAVVQDGVSPVLYVDGVAIASSFLFPVSIGTWLDSATGLDNGRLGCLNYNNNGETAHFNGNIDDFQFINRALTQPQLLDVYNSGSPKDESAIANGVSYYLMGDASGDNWNSGVANEWQFIDQISSNNAFTVNCEQADVELDTP